MHFATSLVHTQHLPLRHLLLPLLPHSLLSPYILCISFRASLLKFQSFWPSLSHTRRQKTMNPSAEFVEQGMSPQNVKRASCMSVITLAYQSLGVVYGDLSTSPLYVYKTTFSGKLSLHEDDEEIYGVLSFIFWTFTLIALVKYIFFVMSADDNGEGGTFALYSLLCRHAKLSILPNQQAADEKLSTYATEASADTWQSSALKSFFEKHPRFHKVLLIFVLLGTCMAIGDGVLTPTISVLSAVSGVKVKITGLHENYVVLISCVILVGLFSLQHHGTNRVAFMFAPIVTAWLLCISSIGIYNIFRWNQHVFCAISPIYMLKFLKNTGTEGWVSLGGVVLSITGVETMFADLGHFSSSSIKVTWLCTRHSKLNFLVSFNLFSFLILTPEFLSLETEEESASKLTSESFREFESTVFKGLVDSDHPYTSSSYKEKTVQSTCDIQAEVAKSGSERLENTQLKHESLQILKAKESGVAYILGHSHARAKKSSSIIKKFAIDVVYTFLSKNCREPDVALNVPHTSLLEVGMIYYV
ncbi:hypothetical protein SADUNF_Sadunf09G0058200 [Salix dunnii]|uniref:Potassium transporter n=1 Tax=Salix dunnii TaxID=1413687 RepID=A0A835JUB2_9ROSI|nr:hypothetical protein SADUNF_Sadunf09G0058200 [Salix dunnii]